MTKTSRNLKRSKMENKEMHHPNALSRLKDQRCPWHYRNGLHPSVHNLYNLEPHETSRKPKDQNSRKEDIATIHTNQGQKNVLSQEPK